ncbi:MAG: hypothetical protein AB7U20_07305 [Planctomycetaceae bacterium]
MSIEHHGVIRKFAFGPGFVCVALGLALSGCQNAEEQAPDPPKAKALDIEAPGVDIEIHKTEDEATIDVEGGEGQS